MVGVESEHRKIVIGKLQSEVVADAYFVHKHIEQSACLLQAPKHLHNPAARIVVCECMGLQDSPAGSRNQYRLILPGSGDIDSNLNRQELQPFDFLSGRITFRPLDQLQTEHRVGGLGWELAEYASTEHGMLRTPG
jgi:hypothetical protein